MLSCYVQQNLWDKLSQILRSLKNSSHNITWTLSSYSLPEYNFASKRIKYIQLKLRGKDLQMPSRESMYPSNIEAIEQILLGEISKRRHYSVLVFCKYKNSLMDIGKLPNHVYFLFAIFFPLFLIKRYSYPETPIP